MTKKQQKKNYLLQIIFVASLFLIIFMAGITYKNYSNLSKSVKMVSHTYEVKKGLLHVLSTVKDAELGLRGYIISKDTTLLQLYTQSNLETAKALKKVRNLTVDNAKQQKNLQELSNLVKQEQLVLAKVYEQAMLRNEEEVGFIELFKENDANLNLIRDKIMYMNGLEDSLLLSRKQVYANTVNLAPILLYAITFITLILMYIAYTKMSFNLTRLRTYNTSLKTNKELTDQAEIINHHGTWTWDIDSDDFSFSDNLYRLLGEKAQSFPATLENFLKFVHVEDVEDFMAAVNEMKYGNDMPFIEYRVVLKDHEVRNFKACARRYTAADGSIKLLGVTTDVTTVLANYNQLLDRAHLLEMNNKELAAFNHVASHDLQEPLRKIQTFLSRLEVKEATQLSENGLYYVTRMKSASERMRMLIDDLLQYSRTSRTEKAYERYDTNVLLKAAKHELADLIATSNMHINAVSLPVMCIIPFQIQQLFTNLLSNAIKYREPSRAAVLNITYEQVHGSTIQSNDASPEDDYHKITFTDNGIGFEDEHAHAIFELFNRLHNKDDYTGTGIGLAICKKIVENHKGIIIATGTVNVGARFDIYIPLHLH